ncbi:hypothetical protein K4K53_005037 [Colletotrichum sp. SAR 10_77]|nr:hypothetical protein K4K53_005037 [Colletotrichum sp. SAR 10_77]
MSDPLSVISAIVGIVAAAGKVVEVLGPMVPRSRTLFVPIDDLITVFTNGVLIFNELEESVLKITQSGGDRLMARMQWVRKEGDFSALIIRLQAFKDTTLLLLNILQW